MTIARSHQANLEATNYYHCISRCVQRAFPWGENAPTSKNFDYRRQWPVDRFREPAGIFAVDICAFAVLANQCHPVLRVDREQAAGWTDAEVIARWRRPFSITVAQASPVGAGDTARHELVGISVQQQ